MVDVSKLLEGTTPGPWAWFGNADNFSLYLATTHSGRRYVMGFDRWGMRGAQPCFQPHGQGMAKAAELLQFAVGDKDVVGVTAAKANASVYRMDVRDVDCADARLIAAAPELAARVIELEAENARLNRLVASLVPMGLDEMFAESERGE